MKKLLRLFLTLMLSTSMAYAQTTTTVDEMEQVITVLEDVHQLNEQQQVNLSSKGHKIINKRLDKAIKEAEKTNDSLEETLKKLDVKITKRFNERLNKTNKILENPRQFKKQFKRLKKLDSTITENQFKERLKEKVSYSKFQEEKQLFLDDVQRAGSYVQYLRDYKNQLNHAVVSKGSEKSLTDRYVANMSMGDINPTLDLLLEGGIYIGFYCLIVGLGWVSAGTMLIILGVALVGALLTEYVFVSEYNYRPEHESVQVSESFYV